MLHVPLSDCVLPDQEGNFQLNFAYLDHAGMDNRPQVVDPLNFLRCCTLRITCAVTFGIPVQALTGKEVQTVVNSVNGYFKVQLSLSWRVALL